MTENLELSHCGECNKLMKELRESGYDVGGWYQHGFHWLAIAPRKDKTPEDLTPLEKRERKRAIEGAQARAEQYYHSVYENGDIL